MLHLLHFSDSMGAGVDSGCHFPTSRTESAAKGELRDGFRGLCAARRTIAWEGGIENAATTKNVIVATSRLIWRDSKVLRKRSSRC